MTYKEEITKLIRASYDQGAKDAQQETLAALEQIVAAARADEREACAKVCDPYVNSSSDHEAGAAMNIQDAIRARGERDL